MYCFIDVIIDISCQFDTGRWLTRSTFQKISFVATVRSVCYAKLRNGERITCFGAVPTSTLFQVIKKYPLRVFVCFDFNLTNNNLWKIGPEYREMCSGHGKDIAGRCRCSPLYSGHKCQYRDECSEDKDCGRHGKCFHLEGATSFPKRQCFCEMGWFGPLCNKRKCLSFLFFLKHDISIHHCVCHNVRYGMTYGSSRLTLDARTNDQLLLPQQVHLI